MQCIEHNHMFFALVWCGTIKCRSKTRKCHFLVIFGIFGRVFTIHQIFSRKCANWIQLEILHKLEFSLYIYEFPQSNHSLNTIKMVSKSPFLWKSIDWLCRFKNFKVLGEKWHHSLDLHGYVFYVIAEIVNINMHFQPVCV